MGGFGPYIRNILTFCNSHAGHVPNVRARGYSLAARLPHAGMSCQALSEKGIVAFCPEMSSWPNMSFSRPDLG